MASVVHAVDPLAVPGRTLPAVLYAVLREPSGYADEARAFLLALDAAGYGLPVQEARWTDADAGLTGAQTAVIERSVALPRPAGDAVIVHHLVPHPDLPAVPGSGNVSRSMFETDRLHSSWLPFLLRMDLVWVPSSFNVETYQRGGFPGDRLRVLPGTLDFDLFAPGAEPRELPGRRRFAFLANFDFTDRKGWDVLLDAWAAAFHPDDDVCLVLKCLGMHVQGGEIAARVDAHLHGRRTAPILLDMDVVPARELPSLYAAADAFVLPSRGEGWGRPYMEAMALGLPTIGSRWSANLEFMHDGNSWLVDGVLVDVPDAAQRHTPLYRGQRWFDPDRDALVAALREVAAGGHAVAARARSARGDLLARFGPHVVAERLVELVDEAVERWRWRVSRPVACVWRGEWGGVHSLAVVNDGVTAALERRGLRVERALRAQNAHDIAAPGVAQQWPPRFEPPSAGPFVLYQPWEYGRVPARWVADIRELVDEVWVPSEATRRAYVDSGVSPDLVHVVPNGVDLDRFTPQGSRWPLPAAGTTFLFVGGTIPRKGVDVLLEAYRRAFGAGDDVLLVVKSFGAAGVYRGQTADGLLEELAADPSAPPLLVLADDVAAGELPALYRAADVLVQPYRGEGFCLPALEALACGVPVAVTAGGPTDEFVTDGCGWRIPSVAVTFPADAIASPHELAGDGVLLEPDVDALAHVLADAARPERRAAKARAARPQAERFGWERAAAAASARLDELRELTPVRHLPPADVAGRRRTLLACLADWDDRATWAPALGAYTAAFSPNDDVTLVLPATDPERAEALVVAELAERGIDPRSIPDVAIAATAGLGATSLELTADAVIACGPRRPTRARRVLECDAESVASAIAI